MKEIRFFAALLLVVLFGSSSTPPVDEDGRKAAYEHYYKGNYYYGEGQYNRAVYHFQQAFDAIPEEFNFAMSLGVGLGTLGKTSDAIALLKRCRSLVFDKDPDFKQKTAMLYFFEGVSFCYGKQFSQAVAPLKAAIDMQETLGKPEVLSVMYNTLGYATLLNQGQGAHRGEDRPVHYHIRRDDLQRSLDLFKTALHYNGRNEIAGRNYHAIGDTLGIPKATFDTAYSDVEVTQYASLPNNTSQINEFADYDELVLLLDISGSMVMENVVCRGVTRFQVMKETSLFLLDQIKPETKMGIGTIGGDCDTPPKLWHRAGNLSYKDLRSTLEFLVPDGTTPLLNILVASPQLFSDNKDTKKALLLVSDGANICRMRGIDICEWSQQLQQQGITINVLTFLNADLSNSNAFAEYTCLADNTFGKVLYIDAYNCRLTPFSFQLVESVRFQVPEFQRVSCWGPAFKELWAVFP